MKFYSFTQAEIDTNKEKLVEARKNLATVEEMVAQGLVQPLVVDIVLRTARDVVERYEWVETVEIGKFYPRESRGGCPVKYYYTGKLRKSS